MSSSEIQSAIDSAVSSKNGWNAELMVLNSKLVTAKKLSEKRSLKKGIKNAEDQIKDLDRSIRNLSNDLKRMSIIDSRSESKNILAEQGLTKGSMLVDSVTKLATEVKPILQGTQQNSIKKKVIASESKNKNIIKFTKFSFMEEKNHEIYFEF